MGDKTKIGVGLAVTVFGLVLSVVLWGTSQSAKLDDANLKLDHQAVHIERIVESQYELRALVERELGILESKQ